MKGQTSISTLIGITLISTIVGSGATWLTNNILAAPANAASTLSTMDSRVTTLETKEVIQERSNLNQSNKTDYLVQAVYRISNKLNVDVGSPPINR